MNRISSLCFNPTSSQLRLKYQYYTVYACHNPSTTVHCACISSGGITRTRIIALDAACCLPIRRIVAQTVRRQFHFSNTSINFVSACKHNLILLFPHENGHIEYNKEWDTEEEDIQTWSQL